MCFCDEMLGDFLNNLPVAFEAWFAGKEPYGLCLCVHVACLAQNVVPRPLISLSLSNTVHAKPHIKALCLHTVCNQIL